MKLSSFDGRRVRITQGSDVFEGECSWLPPEYCDIELGREDEALQIDNWVFYKEDITRVELAEEHPEYVWLSRREHHMRLQHEPFRRMETGEKTIELRLWDEKRRQLCPGDIIRFEDTEDETEVLRAYVKALHVFESFEELYRRLPLDACGYAPDEIGSASPRDMERFYPPEAQARCGVVGIELELV